MREKIAIALGLIMAVGAWFIYQQLGPPPQPTAQIVVANHDIAVYQIIDTNDIRWKTVPANAVDPDWITSPSDVLGMAAQVPMLTGESIHRAKLTVADQTLEDGYRAVAVPTNLIAATGGQVQPGDVVDIYYVPKTARAPGGALVTAVSVIDIRTSDNQPYRTGTQQRRTGGVAVSVAGEQLTAGGGDAMPGLVILKLKPDDIPPVLQATSAAGLVTLVRRAPDDMGVVATVTPEIATDNLHGNTDTDASWDWNQPFEFPDPTTGTNKTGGDIAHSLGGGLE